MREGRHIFHGPAAGKGPLMTRSRHVVFEATHPTETEGAPHAPGIFVFVSGMAGTGKTTLIEECTRLFPEYACYDFDPLFIGPGGEAGIEVSPEGRQYLQGRLDALIATEPRPIILAGVNFLQNDLRAQYSIVLDTPAWTVVRRLWHRAQAYGENRWWALLAWWHVWRMRWMLIHQGFVPMTHEQIIMFLTCQGKGIKSVNKGRNVTAPPPHLRF